MFWKDTHLIQDTVGEGATGANREEVAFEARAVRVDVEDLRTLNALMRQ